MAEVIEQIKEVVLEANGEVTITPDPVSEGVPALQSVKIVANVPSAMPATLSVVENGTYTPQEGSLYGSVTVNVPSAELDDLSVTENGVYTAQEGEGYGKVTVAVPEKNIQYMESLRIGPTGKTWGTIYPQTGYDGIRMVDWNINPASSVSIKKNGSQWKLVPEEGTETTICTTDRTYVEFPDDLGDYFQDVIDFNVGSNNVINSDVIDSSYNGVKLHRKDYNNGPIMLKNPTMTYDEAKATIPIDAVRSNDVVGPYSPLSWGIGDLVNYSKKDSYGKFLFSPNDMKDRINAMTGPATEKSLLPMKTTLRIDVDGYKDYYVRQALFSAKSTIEAAHPGDTVVIGKDSYDQDITVTLPTA